jgi:hypothetical protein
MGDKVITETAATGAGYLEARFRQIHATFARKRGEWLAAQLERNVFGKLPEELFQAARISETESFRNVQAQSDRLSRMLADE